MNGTVTISLADYESLKNDANRAKHYLDIAAEQVEILERANDTLTSVTHIVEVDDELIIDINKARERWYG